MLTKLTIIVTIILTNDTAHIILAILTTMMLLTMLNVSFYAENDDPADFTDDVL